MLYLTLESVRSHGDEPMEFVAATTDVAAKELHGFGRFDGDEIHFMSPTGRLCGKATSLQVLETGAILRGVVTDNLIKHYLSEGDLSGVFISKDGTLAFRDTPVAKSTFLYRADSTNQLAKRFRGPGNVRGVEVYGYRASNFAPVRPMADASCRNGLPREVNNALAALTKAAPAPEPKRQALNKNSRFTN